MYHASWEDLIGSVRVNTRAGSMRHFAQMSMDQTKYVKGARGEKWEGARSKQIQMLKEARSIDSPDHANRG